MSKKKVGLFFGTFDPIHNGHIKIAEYITEKKLTDEVWLVVTPENPIKLKSKISNFKHTFARAYDSISTTSPKCPPVVAIKLSPVAQVRR